jgi:hypothetical protein
MIGCCCKKGENDFRGKLRGQKNADASSLTMKKFEGFSRKMLPNAFHCCKTVSKEMAEKSAKKGFKSHSH